VGIVRNFRLNYRSNSVFFFSLLTGEKSSQDISYR
jgi:hypothetical protein